MTRVFTLDDTAAILDVFQKHGHTEIDTARVYGEGSSEEYLGNLHFESRGLVMDTKLYLTALRPGMSPDAYSHTPADLRKGLLDSLKALKTKKLKTWYLHGPDRTTPFEDTLREVDKLHKEGYFESFGISNSRPGKSPASARSATATGSSNPPCTRGYTTRYTAPSSPSCSRVCATTGSVCTASTRSRVAS
jgi:aryl-alcohol dehydrogenase-like predicted oxidoreductase